ncbi:MAG: complex I subunit 1 family protein [Planctomycetota bacterium]
MPELFPLPAQVFISLCVILVVLHLILLSTAYLIFLERKVASWAQDRIGPNRTDFSFGQENLITRIPLVGGLLGRLLVGPKALFGLGQALADGVKLLIKEDYTPPRVDKGLFFLAPILAVVPAMLGWAVIPWGGLWEFPGVSLFGIQLAEAGRVSVAVAPLSIGAIFILAIGSLAVYGVALAGYASNNKFSFLGGLRATAQMLSYEIPMGVCVLIMILMYQSADLGLMTNLQAGGTEGGWFSATSTWGLFAHPLLAVIFFTCILAECNRAPFDLAEAEQELVGGFHTEFGSMKWALFFLGEYIHMITGCAFFAVLFLGGWDPFPFLNIFPQVTDGFWEGLLVVLLKFGVLAGKVALLLFVMMWVRWTLPRFRYDQLMKLAWRSIIPMMLVMLLVVGTMVFAGIKGWWWYAIANVGVAVLGAVLSPRLPQGPAVNRKVGLAGSRFSPLDERSREVAPG